MDEKYVVRGFYDSDYRGLDTDFKSDDWSQVEMAAHEMLSNGNYVQITNTESGLDYKIEPDEYFNDFNGEFPIKPEALEANKSLDHEVKKYSVESYYGMDINGHPFGLESSMETDEWSQVEENAHEMLSSGKNVTITDKETGKSLEIYSDAYIDNIEDFNGEFPFKPQDLEQSLEEKAVELMNDFFQSFQKNDIQLSETAKAHNRETTLSFLSTSEGREQFKDQLAYIAEQNPAMGERAAALLSEIEEKYPVKSDKESEPPYKLPDGLLETIKEMPAGAVIHTDEYLDDIVLVIEKDKDFTKGIIMETVLEDEFNMVTVDFQKDGKSIASTSDIHVQDLEQVLNDIRNGDTSYLIDEDKPLSELARGESKEKVDKMQEITREEVIQYCLNQGTGIVNYVDTPAADLETAETTQAERDAAAKSGHEPREVAKATVDYFYEAAQSEPTVNRAIKEDMSLLDLDEWQATNEITGVQLSWEDAREIINVLYENYDVSPMDCEASENTRTIAEAFGIDDLSPKHELAISDILDKYEGAKVEFDKSRLSEYNLADTIEQHMFERGEYDFGESDRIRWLDGLPNAYELAENPEALSGARQFVTASIENDLKTVDGREALKNYLNDELHQLDKGDEDYERVQDCLRTIDFPSIEYLQDNFEVKSAYDYLEEKYPQLSVGEFYDDENVSEDTIYVNVEPNGSTGFDDYDDDRDIDLDFETTGVKDELNEIYRELNKYLEDGSLEPVVAVDSDGKAAVVPYMLDTENNELLDYHDKIVPKLEEIIDKHNPFNAIISYQTREDEFDETEIPVKFEADSGLYEMYDYTTKYFEKLVQEGEKTLEKNDLANEWSNYGDIGYLDEGGVQVKGTDREGSFDVVMVVPHPDDENKAFAGHTVIDVDDYKEDEKIIALVKEAWGEDYAYTDKDLAAIVAESEGLVELSMTAFNENGAQAGYAMNYEAYEVDKLTLARGLEEMGISTNGRLAELEQEAAEAANTQKETEEYSDILASVASLADIDIDKIEDDRYALYNKEIQDYTKDEFGFMYVVAHDEAEEVITNLGDIFERIQDDLGECLEESGADSHDIPDSPKEWVEYADTHKGEEFVEAHKMQFDAMRLYENPEKADVGVAYEKQEKSAEKAKETAKEAQQTKKAKKDGLTEH